MIRTLTLSGRRNSSMMEGVLQVSKIPNHEAHSSLQAWQCDQESSEYDCGSPGNLLSAQVAAARLARSSPDKVPESELLPPKLHNLESGRSLLSSDVLSANPTANFLLPKSSIWGTGDSEYSWAQESLSRSSGSLDDSSLLSSETLGNDATPLLETSKVGDSLMHQWPLPNSSSAAVPIHSGPAAPYQRRSWQLTSDDDHTSAGLLIPNMKCLPGYSHSFPALSSSSCLDTSKFNMDYLAGERTVGNFEATSVYDSMARKIHNQMSGFDVNSGNSNDLSSVGFPTPQIGQTPERLLETSGNVANGVFMQHKNCSITPVDQDKTYSASNSRVFFNHNSPSSTLDTGSIMNTTSSNQRCRKDTTSSKLLLESLSGNSVLNMSLSESVLGSHSYLYPTQKTGDPLESLKKWPTNAAATGPGMNDFSGNNSGLGNLGRFPYTTTLGDNEDGQGLYDLTWPLLRSASVGQQPISVDPATGDDSRKRFLQMSIGQPSSNTSHKRLHMETQNGQAAPTTTMPPASLKRSSSWASSLTSTCSKGQDASVTTGSVLPHTKSSSRHAVGPALNTNLKPRARQGSANDPQSIAARVRRERISERLKVLQDLVPNGSKVDLVTMLEKAINYVKFLQLQVKVLTTDDYWPSNENGAAPCTALPNFEDMESALKVLVAQAQKEANNMNNMNDQNISGNGDEEKSSEGEEMESDSPGSSYST